MKIKETQRFRAGRSWCTQTHSVQTWKNAVWSHASYIKNLSDFEMQVDTTSDNKALLLNLGLWKWNCQNFLKRRNVEDGVIQICDDVAKWIFSFDSHSRRARYI